MADECTCEACQTKPRQPFVPLSLRPAGQLVRERLQVTLREIYPVTKIPKDMEAAIEAAAAALLERISYEDNG